MSQIKIVMVELKTEGFGTCHLKISYTGLLCSSLVLLVKFSHHNNNTLLFAVGIFPSKDGFQLEFGFLFILEPSRGTLNSIQCSSVELREYSQLVASFMIT